MTRDELREIVEGISDEQLKKILDINSLDIKKVKMGSEELKAKLDEAEAKGEKMAEELLILKENQREADEIKVRMEELQKVVDMREEADREALFNKDLCRRFDEVSKGTSFVNEFTRNGIFEQFKMAIGDEKNFDSSDSEIFGQLTNGIENIFVPQGDVPKVVASATGFGGALSDNEIREIMGI